VRRELPGGYELDDDPDRIDVDEVHRFLSEESYWAEGRPREVVERLVREASRVIGLYAGERQLGFGRVVTDGIAFAYLADVYVHPDLRGQGLGVVLVEELVENGPYRDVGWLLHTTDAPGLYGLCGFAEPTERVLERRKGAPSRSR